MYPKIFITPWITLDKIDLDKLIISGANTARINTGKLFDNHNKISELINYYYQRHFKFYLDLTGNKPRVLDIHHKNNRKCFFEIENEVIISQPGSIDVPTSKNHNLISTYLPISLLNTKKSDLNVDDGNLTFEINKVYLKNHSINYIKTKVIKNIQNKVFIQDGISSSNVFIHTGYESILTDLDKNILKNISKSDRNKIKYIVTSFTENFEQIQNAIIEIKNLGYKNFQIVPKIETIVGISNIKRICSGLKTIYGKESEIQIGRGDLSLDSTRGIKKINYNALVDNAIIISKKENVKISVLALVLQSSRNKFKLNNNTKNLLPSKKDINNILHLCKQKVYQIGLTNDMYIDKPERIVKILKDIITSSI